MIPVLYCSGDPEVLGEQGDVKRRRRRRNMGLIVSTLQTELCVSAVCETVPSGLLHSEI